MRFRDDVVTSKPSTELGPQMRDGSLPLKVVSGSMPQQALAQVAGLRRFSISRSATSVELLGPPEAGLLSLTEEIDHAPKSDEATIRRIAVASDRRWGEKRIAELAAKGSGARVPIPGRTGE